MLIAKTVSVNNEEEVLRVLQGKEPSEIYIRIQWD